MCVPIRNVWKNVGGSDLPRRVKGRRPRPPRRGDAARRAVARAADILQPSVRGVAINQWVRFSPRSGGVEPISQYTPCVLDGTSVDAAAAAKILDRFPSFEKIHETARNDGQSAAGFAAVEGALLKVDKQAPAALRWIMTSNKAHLVALPPNMRLLERIAPEATCRQFIMLSQPPARQARFAALKARHGSKFAWHGSPAENWHCILR